MSQGKKQTLEYVPVLWIPYPYASVEAARSYPLSIKGNSIDLAEVTLKGTQTLARLNVPDLGSRIIASRDNKVTMNLQASYAGLMAHKHASAGPRS